MRVCVEVLLQQLPRERIQLFDTSDGCVLVALVGTVLVECSVDLTSAENDTVDFIRFSNSLTMLRVWDDPLELRFASEFLNA